MAGISKLMVTGTCEKISKEAAKLAEKHPGYLYFTAGEILILQYLIALLYWGVWEFEGVEIYYISKK